MKTAHTATPLQEINQYIRELESQRDDLVKAIQFKLAVENCDPRALAEVSNAFKQQHAITMRTKFYREYCADMLRAALAKATGGAPTIEQAQHAMDEYHAQIRAGGEPHYPQWAADVLK